MAHAFLVSSLTARLLTLLIQQALETALHRFCSEKVTVFGAGRTDAGVHALAQVAHVDLARTPRPTRSAVRSTTTCGRTRSAC